MIAALYVATDGCYFGLRDVDPWDQPRDAKTVRRSSSCCRSSPVSAVGKVLGRAAASHQANRREKDKGR